MSDLITGSLHFNETKQSSAGHRGVRGAERCSRYIELWSYGLLNGSLPAAISGVFDSCPGVTKAVAYAV